MNSGLLLHSGLDSYDRNLVLVFVFFRFFVLLFSIIDCYGLSLTRESKSTSGESLLTETRPVETGGGLTVYPSAR